MKRPKRGSNGSLPPSSLDHRGRCLGRERDSDCASVHLLVRDSTSMIYAPTTASRYLLGTQKCKPHIAMVRRATDDLGPEACRLVSDLVLFSDYGIN